MKAAANGELWRPISGVDQPLAFCGGVRELGWRAGGGRWRGWARPNSTIGRASRVNSCPHVRLVRVWRRPFMAPLASPAVPRYPAHATASVETPPAIRSPRWRPEIRSDVGLSCHGLQQAWPGLLLHPQGSHVASVYIVRARHQVSFPMHLDLLATPRENWACHFTLSLRWDLHVHDLMPGELLYRPRGPLAQIRVRETIIQPT